MWFVLLFQSKYKEEGKKEASMSLYSVLPETPETQHAREASELRSEVLMSGTLKEQTFSNISQWLQPKVCRI